MNRQKLTINLRRSKANQENERPLTSSFELKPRIQYKPLGYSSLMNQSRGTAHRKVATEAAEESLHEIDDQIQQLIEQNEKLTTTLQNKHSKQPSFGIQALCEQGVLLKGSGIDFERLYNRIDKLENTIETQHKEIEYLRSVSQAHTERTQRKQQEEIKSLSEKNVLLSEMISHQHQEIENYKQLTLINNQLKAENKELLHQIKQYENKVQEFSASQAQVECQIQEVLKENERLKQLMYHSRDKNSNREKDNWIKELQHQIEQLSSQVKIEEEENQYLRNLKINEMKNLIMFANSPVQKSEQSMVYSVRSEELQQKQILGLLKNKKKNLLTLS